MAKDDNSQSRLLWDVARCTGENPKGQCAARNDCLRAIEFDDAGRFTPKFEAPTDAPLSVGCEFMI